MISPTGLLIGVNRREQIPPSRIVTPDDTRGFLLLPRGGVTAALTTVNGGIQGEGTYAKSCRPTTICNSTTDRDGGCNKHDVMNDHDRSDI